jgi:hypothetical protein
MKGHTKKKILFNANAQQLNINTIITANNNIINQIQNHTQNPNANNQILYNDNANINLINTIINKNVSTKYNIIKYLGEGIQGSLYLATNNKSNKSNTNNKQVRYNNKIQQQKQNTITNTFHNDQRFICKKITLDDENIKQKQQLEFELNILKYLSSNKNTREHINPCLEHKIVDNQVFTIFPIFDGYSLNHVKKYLGKLNHKQYYQILFHIIKVILHGLAKIHQTNIAHQNINTNSILVSTYTNPDNVKVKFTDFGLGCGIKKQILNMIGYGDINRDVNGDVNVNGNGDIDIKDYKDDAFFNISSCKSNNIVPIKINSNIINQLSESNYLAISQKYDLLCLGMIFLKMLLVFEKFNIDLTSGYTNSFRQHIHDTIYEKYINTNTNKSEVDIFPFLNISNESKKSILEYLKIFWKYVLCKTEERQNCQYVLDKIIIYEKYKNDVF